MAKGLPSDASEIDPSADSAEPKGGAAGEDVVLVHSRKDDGAYRILRKKDEALYVGELREAREGQPLTPGGELVSLAQREGTERVFDVTSSVKVPGPSPSGVSKTKAAAGDGDGRRGPAKVTSDAYREGFRAIWGSSRSRARDKKNDLN